ncbi:alpha-glucosidase [Terribacillus saccharophilus]|uniref:glycoside hydrolase family 13 protein n=1 Tax=Terribacillus saccharophilus TaxID=361277 RepID=UPI003982A49E
MERKYWKESVIYELYTRSFKDSDGDGIGDLGGILEKIDYLEYLGVDTVWLPPIYVSPNVDHGYDVKEFRAIQPEYGTMEQFDTLLAELHRRGIKLVLDIVPNHTSIEHEWFQQAKRSKDNPYHDYFIWEPANDDGSPPSDWRTHLGRSAWTWNEQTEEYYLHLYSEKQPDLNWDNPKVRQEIYDIMRFWLEKGIDGFRIDAVNVISKDRSYPDADEDKLQAKGDEYFKNGPHIHDYLQEMNKELKKDFEFFTAGETSAVHDHDVLKYTKPEWEELDMVLSAEATELADQDEDKYKSKEWTVHDFREVLRKWQKDVGDGGGWFGLYLSHHDAPRMVSTFADDGKYRIESAKLLATLLHTLRGTPFIFQGEELGMTNYPGFDSIETIKEQEAHSYYDLKVNEQGASDAAIMERLQKKTRDHSRTPMQWDASAQAGFTTGTPWLPVNPNYKEINVQAGMDNPDSVLQFYRKLIRLRKENAIMVYGGFEIILDDHDQIFGYLRRMDNEEWVILLNMTDKDASYDIPSECVDDWDKKHCVISNYPHVDKENTLRPFEAVVYKYVK